MLKAYYTGLSPRKYFRKTMLSHCYDALAISICAHLYPVFACLSAFFFILKSVWDISGCDPAVSENHVDNGKRIRKGNVDGLATGVRFFQLG